MKDHPGPTGQLKCLVVRLNSLEERIIELESAVATRDETLAEQEALATKSQDALLAMISELEDKIDRLQIGGENGIVLAPKLDGSSPLASLAGEPSTPLDSTERETHHENTVGAEEMQSLSGLSKDQELAVSVIHKQVDQGGKRKDAILDGHDGKVLGSSAS